MRAGLHALALAAALSSAAAAAAEQFEWRLPLGFPLPSVPADNPMSDAKVALGRELFADPRLSVTGKHSCQSCHDPARAFTDGRSVSRGALGEELPLNAPTLLNAVYNPSQGWRDPAVRSLEQQMRGPMFNEHPAELGLRGRETDIERELRADRELARRFARVFPGNAEPVSMDNVIRAIAAYERTLIRGDSPFDRYAFSGDHEALTETQKQGMALFFLERAGCAGCHGGINFAGEWVDAAHPQALPAFADTGTGQAVRVPTLRNLGATAPYLHDGRLSSVEAVLEQYERLAADPGADVRLRRAPLTTAERNALRDFLRALDSY
jgi:cytochrome c peroxidase